MKRHNSERSLSLAKTISIFTQNLSTKSTKWSLSNALIHSLSNKRKHDYGKICPKQTKSIFIIEFPFWHSYSFSIAQGHEYLFLTAQKSFFICNPVTKYVGIDHELAYE